MSLEERFQILNNKRPYRNAPGTVDIIFEINKNKEKDERGLTPVFIQPVIEDKKRKSGQLLY